MRIPSDKSRESRLVATSRMRQCTAVSYCLLVSAIVLVFLFAIFLLIPFPIALFPSIVKSQVYLQQNKDGQFPKATFFWSSLPAIQYFDFYFFNITNPDEVVYQGAMANLVEIGPYSYAETEFKEEITFQNGGNQVFYRNNKTWVYSPSTSCPDCRYDDVLTLPNAAYMSVLYMQKTQGMTGIMVTVLDIFSLLIGEAPTRTVPMAGVTFESYPDPFISFINSNFTRVVLNFLGNPIPIPNIPAMGYFPLYNHTSDGNYTSLTGKDNTDNLGLIQKWCDQSHLPWWGDNYSQDISGSGDGSFQKPQLKKTDTLKQFQSFTCRSFYLHFDSEQHVNGIDAYRFKMNTDTYDTTTELNKGYRYENIEKVDYFPSYPCGLNHSYNPGAFDCSLIDCSLRQYWCNPCCNGTHYGDTVFLPPGIIPLRCLPGQTTPLPFAGFLSPPHFLWSPSAVTDSMYGLHPDPIKHDPGSFDIQPLTGSTVGAYFRMQLSVPIYYDKQFTLLANVRNSFLPSFWLDLHVQTRDYATNYIKFNTVTLPHIILGVGIGLAAISLIGALIFIFCLIRRRKRGVASSIEVTSSSASETPSIRADAWS